MVLASVNYSTEDRQWDVRVNVQEDAYLENLLESIVLENAAGKFKYVLVGGLEIGTRSNQSDYKVRHVHIAVIFHNRASKSSIIKNWGIIEGNGYYMVPRNREMPYKGWRDHHIKPFSKVSENEKDWILYEQGELPKDTKAVQRTERGPEEKKRKIDEVIMDMKEMMEAGKDSEAMAKYPRNFLIYGARIKATIQQKIHSRGDTQRNPHIWLHGYPGSGKTTLMELIFPNSFKKDLSNRFFDLLDPEHHKEVLLNDVDPDNVERLGVQFFKTICDEGGFTIDQKYKTPQPVKVTALVTSNFSIPECIPDDCKNIEVTKVALFRRFWHIQNHELLRVLGIKLIDPYERNMLKKAGNEDVRKIYYSFDHLTGQPTGEPLKTAEEYQQMIRDKYYGT